MHICSSQITKPIQTKTGSFSLCSYIHVALRTLATKTTTRRTTTRRWILQTSEQESHQERSREAWEAKAPPRSRRGLRRSFAFDGGSACRQLPRCSNFGPPVEGHSRYKGLDRDRQASWANEGPVCASAGSRAEDLRQREDRVHGFEGERIHRAVLEMTFFFVFVVLFGCQESERKKKKKYFLFGFLI